MREDILGRSRVEDTDELVQFYRRLETMGAGALWTVANDIERGIRNRNRCRCCGAMSSCDRRCSNRPRWSPVTMPAAGW